MSKLSRRRFLQLGMGTTLTGSALAAWIVRPRAVAQNRPQNEVPAVAKQPPAPKQATASDTLPKRILGQTGQQVTIFGLGGASSLTPLSNGPQDQAVAIIERALELGVNYFDTASSYGEGRSENALGEVAKKRRSAMVIASKTGERTYDAAMRELETSLKRLQTDHLDVWLMHHVSFSDRDTKPAFAKDGAIKALEKAKAEKMVRFGGVSGHHRTDVLVEWLRRYQFDMALMPINAVEQHNPDSFIQKVLPLAEQRQIGVVAMKIPAYGRLLRPNQGVGIEEAFAYSLSQRGVASGIIACDSIKMLEENVAAARKFAPMDAKATAELEAKTASYWQRASFYRRWT